MLHTGLKNVIEASEPVGVRQFLTNWGNEMSELVKGDFFTIVKWKDDVNDDSYIGSIFKVTSIDHPFFNATRHSGFIWGNGTYCFSLDKVTVKKLSDEFVNDAVPGLIAPFRASEFKKQE